MVIWGSFGGHVEVILDSFGVNKGASVGDLGESFGHLGVILGIIGVMLRSCIGVLWGSSWLRI